MHWKNLLNPLKQILYSVQGGKLGQAWAGPTERSRSLFGQVETPCFANTFRSNPHSQIVAKSFTLVEMLVVMAVLSILVAMLVPALRKATFAARNTSCMANLKHIGSATSLYQNDYYEHFPVTYFQRVERISYDDLLGDYDGRNLTSVQKNAWSSTGVRTIYLCPLITSGNVFVNDDYRTYIMNCGSADKPPLFRGISGTILERAFSRDKEWSARLSQVSQPSQTIAYGDGPETDKPEDQPKPVGCPENMLKIMSNYTPFDSLTLHNNKGNFLMCDGHVQSVYHEDLTKGYDETGTIWDMWKK